MSEANEPRPGRYMTLRLFEAERDRVQNLGRLRPGVEDRHAAFLELVPIVERLDLENLNEKERRPLRVKIPEALDEAITQKVKETGQTYIAVLLAAAEQYRDRQDAAARRRR